MPKPASEPIRHIALFRGLNVGGKHLVAMDDLARLFEGLGCTDVKTHIQSGNVVFQAPPRAVKSLPGKLERAFAKEFGFDAPVILRSGGALAAVVRDNPFARRGTDATKLHVVFLAEPPSVTNLARLDPQRSPGDRFEVRCDHIYLYLPGGVGKTKLTNQWFDRQLETTSTMRNWKTVSDLLALAQARE